MTLHLIQTELHWENPTANHAHFDELIANLDEGVIVLPEMFSTGFSMASSAMAQTMDGPTITWMQNTAAKKAMTICGSVIIQEDGNYFNRFVWATADGELLTYDKRHLFRMADEHQHYSAGDSLLTVQHQGIKIRPLVCYDLRFPVWSRNHGEEQFDVLLYVANWPAARSEQWLALLRARAIENLCYVIGLNRVGRDGNDIDYAGESVVFGPEGETVLHLGADERIASFTPDLKSLKDYREQFPAHMDADQYIFT